MKNYTLPAIAAAGFLAAGSAHAASYTAGDLLLGFYATGGSGDTTSYVVNIGAQTLYRDATGSFVLNTTGPNIGNIGQDLIDNFGGLWYTRNDLFWGVLGGRTNDTAPTPPFNAGDVNPNSDPNRTLYASRPQSIFGTQSSPWVLGSSSGVSNGAAAFNAFAGLAILGPGGFSDASVIGTANSNTRGAFMPDTLDNDWETLAAAGWSGVFSSQTHGDFTAGAAASAIDLYRIPSLTGLGFEPGTAGTGQYQGTFFIDTLGNVTFGLQPIPEPSTVAMLALAAAAGVVAIRRRRKASL